MTLSPLARRLGLSPDEYDRRRRAWAAYLLRLHKRAHLAAPQPH